MYLYEDIYIYVYIIPFGNNSRVSGHIEYWENMEK